MRDEFKAIHRKLREDDVTLQNLNEQQLGIFLDRVDEYRPGSRNGMHGPGGLKVPEADNRPKFNLQLPKKSSGTL